jgi:DNA-binding MarR family transcriptional regulator
MTPQNLIDALTPCLQFEMITARAVISLLEIHEAESQRYFLRNLAVAAKVSKPAACRITDFLCREGFVRRIRDKEIADLRNVSITITDKGRNFVSELCAAREAK